jgi:hypothetical protein
MSCSTSLGEIAALDYEVFSAWCAAIGYLICHGKSLSCKYDWKNNRLFLHSWELGIYLLSRSLIEAIEKKPIERHPALIEAELRLRSGPSRRA